MMDFIVDDKTGDIICPLSDYAARKLLGAAFDDNRSRHRRALDMLTCDRVRSMAKPNALLASIRAALSSWNAILIVPGGWSIIKPLAMDPILWHAVQSRRALRGEPINN